jgi:hypothetical protein
MCFILLAATYVVQQYILYMALLCFHCKAFSIYYTVYSDTYVNRTQGRHCVSIATMVMERATMVPCMYVVYILRSKWYEILLQNLVKPQVSRPLVLDSLHCSLTVPRSASVRLC